MQLEGNAYTWYMQWKLTTKMCSYSQDNFKNDFFKKFQGVDKNDCFAKITRLEQNNVVDEYTYEWEALATQVPELIDEKRVQTFVSGLKE